MMVIETKNNIALICLLISMSTISVVVMAIWHWMLS